MKVMLNMKAFMESDNIPRKEYLDQLLNDAGLKGSQWSMLRGTTIFEVEKMPQSNGVFGIKWEEVK